MVRTGEHRLDGADTGNGLGCRQHRVLLLSNHSVSRLFLVLTNQQISFLSLTRFLAGGGGGGATYLLVRHDSERRVGGEGSLQTGGAEHRVLVFVTRLRKCATETPRGLREKASCGSPDPRGLISTKP